MALASVEKPVMMMTGMIGLEPPRLADDGQAVHARHLQVGDQQVVGDDPQALERRCGRRARIDIVLGQRQRLRQQIADASPRRPRRGRAAVRRGGRRGVRRRGAARALPRPLALEPGVDVALAEPPLPADAHRRDLAGLDQPVDRPQVDLEVLEDLLGRQKPFVNHVETHSTRLDAGDRGPSAQPARQVRSVKTAPPSGSFAA